jgi:mono/diheme cytochrome c family protein
MRYPLRKALKLLALALVLLVLAAAAAFAAAVWLGERKLTRTVEVKVVPVAFASAKDAAALKLGKYLFESRGCGECHGPDGHGFAFIDEPGGMSVRSPNITTGPGGVVRAYSEADWVRAIRHGVSPGGHALLMMPSEDYNRLTDADFAALVAYVRSLPPVAGEPAELRLPPIVRALYGVGVVRDAAEKIDHRKPPSQPIAPAVTAEYGGYVASMCVGCHRAGLSGGPIPGAPSDWPAAANLTPGEGSAMSRYDDAEKFIAMMRTGKRPDGSAVSKVMPFASLRNLNDNDLAAMHVFLRAMPPRKAGER